MNPIKLNSPKIKYTKKLTKTNPFETAPIIRIAWFLLISKKIIKYPIPNINTNPKKACINILLGGTATPKKPKPAGQTNGIRKNIMPIIQFQSAEIKNRYL